MNFELKMTLLFAWAIYTGLTVYGALRYPYYSVLNKTYACTISLVIPFIGALFVNSDMGHRLSKQAKADLTYELPWWATLGTGASGSQIDDD